MTEFLEQIIKLVKTNKIKAYLVGGAVRDMLLGDEVPLPHSGIDLDITVEGNSLLLGKLLQKEFGGKLISHSEFGTGTLILCNMRIDFANCRKEIYPDSARLPKVENCSLQEDLKRRDFTINTLALDLRTGSLIDLFGGRKDIKNKKIKFLHPKSFIDDPTRIFRALRFAGRLGFTIESETERLMKKAIRDGFIQKLTPKRIRNEIVLILQEPKREKILKLMAKYGILEIIGLKLPEPGLFDNISKNLLQFLVPDSRVWFVYLMGIIDFNALPDLDFTKREAQEIKNTHRVFKDIQLKIPATPSGVYRLLYDSQTEELIYIMSLFPGAKGKIVKYMKEYSKMKTEITGNELSKIGIKKGPLYKELLSQILYARLDGKVKNKEEETKLLRKLIRSL